MQTTIAFRFGRLMGGKWAIPIAILVLAIGFYLFSNEKPIPPPVPAKPIAQPVAQAPDPRDLACGANLDDRRAQAKAAYASKNYELAYELMDYCIARVQSGSAAHAEFFKYATAKNSASDADRAVQGRKDKAAKKKIGVTLGMSRQDALDSIWGRPDHVNTTTTVYGVREQWVYKSRNYLYFENDVLTSIQN